MKIKVEESTATQEIKYPILMKAESDSLIVMFTGYREGIVLSGNTLYSLGRFDEKWDMAFFKPFNGKLTLSNE